MIRQAGEEDDDVEEIPPRQPRVVHIDATKIPIELQDILFGGMLTNEQKMMLAKSRAMLAKKQRRKREKQKRHKKAQKLRKQRARAEIMNE